METARDDRELYREQHRRATSPTDGYVAQLLALLEPRRGRCCSPAAGRTTARSGARSPSSPSRRGGSSTSARSAPGVCAPIREIALRDVLDATERGRAAVPMFTTHALVVRLADGELDRLGAPHQPPDRAGGRGDRRALCDRSNHAARPAPG